MREILQAALLGYMDLKSNIVRLKYARRGVCVYVGMYARMCV